MELMWCFFTFWFSDKAISSVIRAESISIYSFGSLMFEFSVKCNNLIDWHVKQIAFDTLIHYYLATPNFNSRRYSLSTPFFSASTFHTHKNSWNNPDGDMHATNEINSLIVIVKWVLIKMNQWKCAKKYNLFVGPFRQITHYLLNGCDIFSRLFSPL